MNNTISFFFLILTAGLLSGCSGEEGKFVSACEDAIKDNLRSPSGYEQVNVTYRKTQLSKDQFIAKLKKEGKTVKDVFSTNLEQRAFEQGDRYHPTEYQAIIDYDAPNAYGTPVRQKSICYVFNKVGESDSFSKYTVEVDGDTITGRMAKSVVEQYKNR